jgi:hypothetical protein
LLAALAQLVIGYLVDHHSVRIVFATVTVCQAFSFFLMLHREGIAALPTVPDFRFLFGAIIYSRSKGHFLHSIF